MKNNYNTTIYSNGEIYDLVFNDESDIDFWLNYTKEANSILELCCGTGRILSKIDSNNKKVIGIDSSKSMLKRAMLKLYYNKNNNTNLFHRNITNFNLKSTYDLIILANNSLSHLTCNNQIERFFKCLIKHMNSESLFIFEIYTDKVLNNLINQKEKIFFKKFTDPKDNL